MALAFICGPASARAQGGAPFVTDDSGTPGPNRWELNLATTLARGPHQYVVQLPEFDLNYGVGEMLQLNLETSWNFIGQRGSGIVGALGNLEFAVKWRFFESARVGVSVYPRISFNAVSAQALGLLDRRVRLSLPVELDVAIGRADLVAEVGYVATVHGADGVGYGLLVAYGFEHVVVGAESFAAADLDSLFSEFGLNAGLVVDLTQGTSLLASFGGSPREAEEIDLIGYFGVQLRF